MDLVSGKLSVDEVLENVRLGTMVFLDIEAAAAYAAAHPAGAFNCQYKAHDWGQEILRALGGQRPPIALFADDPDVVARAKACLEQSGFSVPYVFDEGMGGWTARGLPVERVKTVSVHELATRREHYEVVDVREHDERRDGSVPGALHIPLSSLAGQLSGLSPRRRYAVICASGNRSAAAAKRLAHHGYEAVSVLGGMAAWREHHLPVAGADD